MHKFTDSDISNVEVGKLWRLEGNVNKGIHFDVYNDDTGSLNPGFFSKEDLIYMLKMIEETN